MSRPEIEIRSRRGTEHRVVLGRFASVLCGILLSILTITGLVLALVFGYLVIGFALAVAVIGLVVAIVRGAWFRLRR